MMYLVMNDSLNLTALVPCEQLWPQGGNVSHERLLLVCPAGSWVLEVQHQSDVCQEMALRGQGESDPIIKMVV